MTTTEPAPLPPGLQDSLGWLLAQCFRAYGEAMGRAVAGIPHGHRGFQALSGAAHCSARNQAELARQLGVDRTVMVYLVDDLAKAGLVERIADPTDRRSRLIRATPAGVEQLASAQQAIQQAESMVLAPLSPAEQGQLRGMLQSLASHYIAHAGNAVDPCSVASELT
ncbi:MarR family winged helix-turn-helix transcriptional regulator [Streptacidiphilus sp. PAMC 29251]